MTPAALKAHQARQRHHLAMILAAALIAIAGTIAGDRIERAITQHNAAHMEADHG